MAIQDISLHELNSMIRETLNDGFPERYWVSAEEKIIRDIVILNLPKKTVVQAKLSQRQKE